jgi:hypothetical protein
MPTSTPPTTPPPITTLNDLDRSLLNSSLPEGTELRSGSGGVEEKDKEKANGESYDSQNRGGRRGRYRGGYIRK